MKTALQIDFIFLLEAGKVAGVRSNFAGPRITPISLSTVNGINCVWWPLDHLLRGAGRT